MAEREKLRGSAERRRAERERATLVAAIEQAAEEILITDTDGTLRYCNRFFEQATGYSRGEVLGNNLRFLKSGAHDDELYRELWHSITDGKVWTGRLTNRRKDGSLYEVDATVSPIQDASGTLTGFVFAGHDVTERLRLESALRQSQKMEALGTLAGGIAHDFNNLMTIILGYCEVMRSALGSSSPLQKQVNEVYKAAEQANTLTRQLLAFSRRQRLQSSSLNLSQVLTDMSEMLRRLVSDDIELTILTDSALGLILANQGQIEQVIMNLVVNASHAMPRGGTLVVAAENARLEEGSSQLPSGGKPGTFVHLTVSDTGVGMAPEVKARIFDPFFTTKESGKGTGLGLAMVYGIVNQADGHIVVESEPEKGTTFHIYFPCAETAIVSDVRPQLVAQRQTRGSETVLVTDDQEGLCTLLCEILRNNGYSVLSAPNGREALRVLREHPGRIDLVITDMVMPQMGGRELAEALRLLQPQTKILCMSGYTDRAEDVNELLSQGHAFIEKPFTPDALLHKIRDVLAVPANSLQPDCKSSMEGS
ncbi:MAG TPA: ATP-binding protein [Anaerolineales bacterium]